MAGRAQTLATRDPMARPMARPMATRPVVVVTAAVAAVVAVVAAPAQGTAGRTGVGRPAMTVGLTAAMPHRAVHPPAPTPRPTNRASAFPGSGQQGRASVWQAAKGNAGGGRSGSRTPCYPRPPAASDPTTGPLRADPRYGLVGDSRRRIRWAVAGLTRRMMP